jgi:hypothetical protein
MHFLGLAEVCCRRDKKRNHDLSTYSLTEIKILVIPRKIFKTCGENDSRLASTQKTRIVNSRKRTRGKTSIEVQGQFT